MAKISVTEALLKIKDELSLTQDDPRAKTIALVLGSRIEEGACFIEVEEGCEKLPRDVFDCAYKPDVSDEDKAMILSYSALLGDVYGMHDLGWCFHFGKGVTENYELAIYWHLQAAEQGDAIAMQNLGKIYTEKDSPVWNGPKGISWFEKGAAAGDPRSKGDLAHCLLCGKCVPKDDSRAETLLIEAIRSSLSDVNEDWQEDLARCPLEAGQVRSKSGEKMWQIDVDFYNACKNGTVEDLKKLVEQGAKPNAPWYNDIGDDFYPIHQAALNPDIEVLKYIVSLGVDPCQKDFWCAEPLSYAAREGSLEKSNIWSN